MNNFSKIYTISLKSHRAKIRKLLRENQQCYESLNDKNSDYAKAIKALLDLHKQAYAVYHDASNNI